MKPYLACYFVAAQSVYQCSSLQAQSETHNREYQYSTKSIYQPKQAMSSYQHPPNGYNIVYSELLSRHGSRALSSAKYNEVALQIWKEAKRQHALTPLGEKLGSEISRLTQANRILGYGNLSQLGKEELMTIGQRMLSRNKPLFLQIENHKRKISVEYSGKNRTRESAKAFLSGLGPQLANIEPQQNKHQLYFHKSQLNQSYKNYIKHNPKLHRTINTLLDAPKTHAIAQAVLASIYKPNFVKQLTYRELEFTRHNKNKTFFYNDVDAVMQLFNLYLISPGLRYEAGDQSWQFEHYFTPEQAAWLSYIQDAEDFYQKGPSFDNTKITYKMADVLKQDFFDQINAIAHGDQTYGAKLRFAHAETIIPFAALMQLQGSEKSASDTALYSYENNPWRGSWVSPYSANIQWDVYQNQSGNLLVRMLYDEKEIAFKANCKPIKPNSFFYDFNELSRCYNYNQQAK